MVIRDGKDTRFIDPIDLWQLGYCIEIPSHRIVESFIVRGAPPFIGFHPPTFEFECLRSAKGQLKMFRRGFCTGNVFWHL